jgi:hypothetical protein
MLCLMIICFVTGLFFKPYLFAHFFLFSLALDFKKSKCLDVIFTKITSFFYYYFIFASV